MIAARELRDAAAARSRLAARGRRVPPVVTVGFFDGVHLGHQRILADLSAWAREAGGLPAVVTFDRHPQEVLSRRPPINISSLEHRLLLLARSGVELALVLHFDRTLAAWSPEEFVARVIREALGARHLLLGFDSAIGRKREGTFDYLAARQAEMGVSVRRAEPLLVQSERVSSTLVREAVLAGDLPRLERLLGRPYSLLGRVAPGERRGRTLGFPTANLIPAGQHLPPNGVYFAEVELLPGPEEAGESIVEISPARGDFRPAVVNIGRRPTFAPPDATPLLEAHLLDFEGDLYGRELEVHLLAHHREEKPFAGPEDLVRQIRRDVEARRAFRMTVR